MTTYDPALLKDGIRLSVPSLRLADEDFNRFYRSESNRLARALSIAIGDADLGNEAIDEGMARAYQRWRRVSAYDSPAGWVYRISMNWARNRLRNQRRELLTYEIKEDLLAQHPEPDFDPALDMALSTLTVEARSVVVLRYLLDWSTADTAQALGVAPGTVKSRLSRALEQLESTLEQQ